MKRKEATDICQASQGSMFRAAEPEELKNGVGVGLGVKSEGVPKMLELPDPKRFPAHTNACESMVVCL